MITFNQSRVFVDVDAENTFIKGLENKLMPNPFIINKIRELYQNGAILYCWSAQGEDFARDTAEILGVEHCFTGFFPKPDVMVETSENDWKKFFYTEYGQKLKQAFV